MRHKLGKFMKETSSKQARRASGSTVGSEEPDSPTEYMAPEKAVKRKVSAKFIPGKDNSSHFHALFPEHADEQLTEEFICAIPMTILVQGKLYVTPKRFCFTSVFSSSRIDIEWSKVEKLEKSVTFPYIPNGIDFYLKDGKVQRFQSFMYRDFTFSFLFQVWVTRVAKSLATPSPTVGDSFLPPKRGPSGLGSSADTINATDDEDDDESVVASQTGDSTVEQVSILDEDSPHSSCSCLHDFHRKKGKSLLDISVPVSVPEMWTIWHDLLPNFITDVQGGTDLTQSIVPPTSSIREATVGTKIGTSYRVSLGLYNPVTNIQSTVRVFEPNNICMESVNTTPDVPYGTSFQTVLRICMVSVAGDPSNTRVVASYHLEFTTDVNWIVKSAVKNQVSGKISEFYTQLAASLHTHFQDLEKNRQAAAVVGKSVRISEAVEKIEEKQVEENEVSKAEAEQPRVAADAAATAPVEKALLNRDTLETYTRWIVLLLSINSCLLSFIVMILLVK
ncbi:MAG: hypothetical protein SGCHY_004936 [Lobulomycetales sp.]